MDFTEALNYILGFADYERLPRSAVVFDLRRVEQLLKRLGNPEKSFRSVHIAGTKGKGSTASLVAGVLQQAGYQTGLFTSPHLLSITERVQINAVPVPQEEFARVTARLQPEVAAVNRAGEYGELTTFELLTALAFCYFRDCGVDYAVVETGLGGRLDATNVLRPEVSAITSISYDHTDVLGDTLAQIAGEKAGIIKPGVPVVNAPQLEAAMMVIERACAERGCDIIRVGQDVRWRHLGHNDAGQWCRIRGRHASYDLVLPLLGDYQLENAAVAVAALEVLREKGAKISDDDITSGMASVRWPGRLQVLRHQPYLIIDGAHNAYSLEKLGKALRDYFKFSRLWVIFGASTDKDVDGMAAALAPLAEEIIVTGSRHPRSVPPEKLAEIFARQGREVVAAESVAAALKAASAQAAPDDLICATGSIFVISEVLEQADGLHKED